MKRLRDPREWVERFHHAVSPLDGKLGPVLVQLPPRWQRDPERLARFLDAVPDSWRVSVEVRDASWLHRSVYDVLREHSAALCIHDLIRHHPRIVTANWLYLRRHGPDAMHPYAGSYSPQELSDLARRIRRHLDADHDVFVYLNNDVEGHAVEDALILKRYLDDDPARDT